MALNEEIKLRAEVCAYALGSASTESSIAATFGLSEERVLEILADGEIECCATCGWWCESSEIDTHGHCDDCRDGEEAE